MKLRNGENNPVSEKEKNMLPCKDNGYVDWAKYDADAQVERDALEDVEIPVSVKNAVEIGVAVGRYTKEKELTGTAKI